MAMFDYKCASCERVKEDHMVTSYKDDVTLPCECGQHMVRTIVRSSFTLKGAGFYENDYKPVDLHRRKFREKGPIKTYVRGSL